METENKIRENDLVLRLIPPQAGFIDSLSRHPAYVAGWGTGKSTAGIVKAMNLTEEYPNNLGVIFRKEFTDLKDSTLKDFELYTGFKVGSGGEYVHPNGSTILFRHSEALNNLQNMNLGWFLIEQAEELETDDIFFKLWGRLRRAGVKHQGFIIANTNGHNWIYRLWKLKELKDAELFEANSFDAEAYLPKDTIEAWKLLKEAKPHIYNRFVMNSWEESDTIDIIIKPEWISKAIYRDLNETYPLKRIVSIDVARYGDDKTVMYAIENNRQLGKVVYEKKSTMETTGWALQFAKKYDIESFAVDEIGVGGGVADRLEELGYQVIFVNAAERENVRTDCYNRRAEIYLNAAELFEAGKVQLLESDKELHEQLSWAKYKTIKSNGIYHVEPKEDIKKRYGRSPDEADAFLNGLWALPQARDTVKRDKYARKQYQRAENTSPMAA